MLSSFWREYNIGTMLMVFFFVFYKIFQVETHKTLSQPYMLNSFWVYKLLGGFLLASLIQWHELAPTLWDSEGQADWRVAVHGVSQSDTNERMNNIVKNWGLSSAERKCFEMSTNGYFLKEII